MTLPSPKGFAEPPKKKITTNISSMSADLSSLKIKKSWEVAVSPTKTIPMNGIMLWMSGGGVQIFSIIITIMLLYNPTKAIFSVNEAFQKFESKKNNLILQKITFVLCQMIVIGMGIWKCSQMVKGI
jgi:hypothetical protein